MENLLEELTKNDGLRSVFLTQTSMENAYTLAKPYVGEMSQDEFSKEMTSLARNIIESGSLTDEMLANVSGGRGTADIPPWALVAGSLEFKKPKN